MSFASKLKELRKRDNLTQEALANKLYVSRQAVTKWECEKSIPDEETIEKIANIFNVDKEYFCLNEKNEKKIKRRRKIKILIITFLSLLILSLIYTIIHLTYIGPTIKAHLEEIRKRESILVAGYISIDEEYLSIDELRNSTRPYIIKDGDEIKTNRLYKTYKGYTFMAPHDYRDGFYYTEIIYNDIKKEYKTNVRRIETYEYVQFYDDGIIIEEHITYNEMEIYSYDHKFDIIQVESFYLDDNGNIISSLNGRLDGYLDEYKIDGAFQYSVIFKSPIGQIDVLTIPYTKDVLTYFSGDNWFNVSSSFYTRFII